jgi:hypothetical protein
LRAAAVRRPTSRPGSAKGGGGANRGLGTRGERLLRQLAFVRKEIQTHLAGDNLQVLVSAVELGVWSAGQADERHQRAPTPGAPRHPGVNPRAQIQRYVPDAADGHHHHVRSGCRLSRPRESQRLTQLPKIPGVAADLLVFNQLPHTLPQFRRPLLGQGILENDGDAQRQLRFLRRDPARGGRGQDRIRVLVGGLAHGPQRKRIAFCQDTGRDQATASRTRATRPARGFLQGPAFRISRPSPPSGGPHRNAGSPASQPLFSSPMAKFNIDSYCICRSVSVRPCALTRLFPRLAASSPVMIRAQRKSRQTLVWQHPAE